MVVRCFYGYTMYQPDGVDSTRYIVKLQRLYEEPRTWDTFIGSFYSIDEGGGSVDIYEPIMVNFVSLFRCVYLEQNKHHYLFQLSYDYTNLQYL